MQASPLRRRGVDGRSPHGSTRALEAGAPAVEYSASSVWIRASRTASPAASAECLRGTAPRARARSPVASETTSASSLRIAARSRPGSPRSERPRGARAPGHVAGDVVAMRRRRARAGARPYGRSAPVSAASALLGELGGRGGRHRARAPAAPHPRAPRRCPRSGSSVASARCRARSSAVGANSARRACSARRCGRVRPRRPPQARAAGA